MRPKTVAITINLRYVDDKAIIHEHFLTYVQAESLNAESLTKYIVDTLTQFQLNLTCIVSQGNDGAAVMSGCCTGDSEQ